MGPAVGIFARVRTANPTDFGGRMIQATRDLAFGWLCPKRLRVGGRPHRWMYWRRPAGVLREPILEGLGVVTPPSCS